MPAVPPRLDVRNLSKTFGAVRVLSDVDLSVAPGEVHGIAGQNGSGKSTLIKVLTGVYKPDPGGHISVDGRAMRLPVRWPEVQAAGISVVHQDLGLLDQLSVSENICVGGFPTGRLGRIDSRARDRLAEATLTRFGVKISPSRLVGTLSAAERAEVAIARGMRNNPAESGLIILDESTRALAGDDLIRVHDLLRRITGRGSAAVMISHNLIELISITDRVTILRDGRVAGAGILTKKLTEEEIARRMLGGDLVAAKARSATVRPASERALTLTGLSGARVTGVDVHAMQGEILGITGLPGNGYEDIPYLMTGASHAETGQLRVGPAAINLAKATVSSCMRLGVVLVPERRDRDGLAFELNVRDNICLPGLRSRSRPWFVGRSWQRRDAQAATKELDIRPADSARLVRQLSGGNQQKVLLAKWLGVGPTAIVLHEPTQAVDVGARQDILTALRRTADSGVSVIMVSSEPDDLVAVCDRILLYQAGCGVRQLKWSTADDVITQIYAREIGATDNIT